MDDDSQSWQDRCDRYFSSIYESGESKQNGHIKTKDKPSTDEEHKVNSDDNPDVWKDLAAVRKRSREHPIIGYIRRSVFKLDVHGTKLAGKSTNHIELLIWGIITLAVFSFTIFLLILQYSEYVEYNTYFRTRSVSSANRVPSSLSLSVCNLNILRRSKLSESHFEYLLNDSIHLVNNTHQTTGYSVKSVLDSNEKLSELLQAITDNTSGDSIISLLERDVVIREMMKVSNESVISRLRNSGRTDWFPDIATLNYSDVKVKGHQHEDIIVSCSIGSRECKESDFSIVTDVEFGNCVTFSPELTSEPVQLILNAEADEYIIGASPSVGFRVVLHRKGSEIRDGQSIHVGVNSLTSIKVRKETVTNRQDDTCIPEPGTKKQCLRDCYETQVHTYCGCSLKTDGTLPVCRNDVIENLICRKTITLLQDKGHMDCGCKESCRDTLYDLTQNNMEWPSTSYMPILSSMIARQHVPLTDTQIRENMAAVHINLNVELRVVQEETKQFQILELLSRFGGLLAFVAGMSVLTLVELVWSILKAIFDILLYFKQRSGRDGDAERLSDSAITSVTWAMYKQKRRQEELDKEFRMNNTRTDKRVGQTSGIGGNVNSRLHRRNSHLEPISENGDVRPGHSESYSAPQRASSNGRENQSKGSNRSFELKQSKYRVMDNVTDSNRLYSNTNGHVPKPYSESNGNLHNGVSLISQPYSNNAYYNYNRRHSSEHVQRPYGNIPPLTSQYPGRGRYEKDDQVQLYGNTSAYFHANAVSEPTFL